MPIWLSGCARFVMSSIYHEVVSSIPRAGYCFFAQPLYGPILNIESDWLVVMFTATGSHVDITTSQSDSRCASFGHFSHNAHLLSFIHYLDPIVLSSLSKFLYNLEIIFFSLIFFLWPLASIFHEYGMIHKKSSAAHNI